MAADAGKQVRVRVSFTDKLGGEESAISEVYPNPGTIAANAAPTGADRTVTVAEDEPYTFGASEFEFADTDGDALEGVKITTLPAAGKGTLELNEAAVVADQVVAASDLGGLVYTPPANANGTPYASFKFKVSDGASESALAYTMTVDVTAVNDPATGAPTISGTARVGQELTADASGIADVDRLPDVSTFEYQWLQVDGGSETAIAEATAKTYRLAPGDAGKQLRVRVSFTDLDGTEESLTSAAYPSSGSVGQSLACHAPDLGERREVWTGEVSVGAGNYGIFGDFYGYYVANGGSVDNPNIEFGAYRYTVDGAFHPSEGSRKGALYFSTVNYLPNEPRLKMTLHVCDEAFPFSESTAALFWGQHREWSHANQDWSEVSTRRLRLSIPPDNDATGVPTISGTARVGEELTADAGAIADVDGLPDVSAFAWQWVRVDGGNEADIDGATGSTYRPVAADAGKQVRVRVSFTDKLGGEESAISEVYPNPGTIAANTAPSAANGTVTVDEDTSYTFQTGGLCLCGHGRRGRACEREDHGASGCGQGDAGSGRDGGDGGPGDRGFGSRQADLHAACGRERPGLCLLRLQGERRDVRERGALHGDDRRDGCERRCDGRTDDHGDGACGPGPDGGCERDRGCGRVACALGVRLAVAAGR